MSKVTSVNCELPFDEKYANLRPQTNADRIRSMTDEELAGWLATNDTCPSTEQERNCNNRCGECWLEWLKQEVTEHSTT